MKNIFKYACNAVKIGILKVIKTESKSLTTNCSNILN